MHPVDRLALAAATCFIAAGVALAPVVWLTFADRWITAVFAATAAMAFIATGWIAREWYELGAQLEREP